MFLIQICSSSKLPPRSLSWAPQVCKYSPRQPAQESIVQHLTVCTCCIPSATYQAPHVTLLTLHHHVGIFDMLYTCNEWQWLLTRILCTHTWSVFFSSCGSIYIFKWQIMSIIPREGHGEKRAFRSLSVASLLACKSYMHADHISERIMPWLTAVWQELSKRGKRTEVLPSVLSTIRQGRINCFQLTKQLLHVILCSSIENVKVLSLQL